ncbi:glycosyltransferase family 2 protein [Fibrobacter sp.]|uniref:glycosyltransferase family 2 protein n=1 Tax=Fibrobacter sp. TaxID=35828 RepID=UPI0038640D1E
MNNPLISVIVPIYNVEVYLRRCLDSVLRQTYRNIEIVLVDDGSPDRCPEICDEYAKNDNRIKVIHQKNGGLAHARNVGIANSKGEYLTFVDSDDYVSDDYVESLYKGLIESDADISVASLIVFKESYLSCVTHKREPFVEVKKNDYFKEYASIKAERSMPFITAWNKLYKKELFDGIKYPKGKLYEDAFTTYKLIERARKIVYSTTKLYYYRLNPQSILGQSFKEKHLEMVEAFRDAMDYFYQKGDDKIAEMFISPLLMREIYCWWGVKKLLKDDNLAKKILDDYKKDSKKLKCTKNIGIIWFLIFKIITFCPWLYVCYRKISPSYMGDRK